MKNSKLFARLLGWFMVLLLAVPVVVMAKDGGGEFSREELAQMLAPVALYPDALLSQVLMAATYPLEVVAADRWVKGNPLLKGDNLDEALRDQDWDASVKALCYVPAVLGVMSERLEETTRLGDAFLVQEKEVMDVIQDLRVRAMREGNLKSDDKQKVLVQTDGTIVIESADPQTVYVPYYNTRYVYGPWWYPAWPPWYWGPGEVVIGSGIHFWPDFYFGFGFGFGYWSHFDWPGRTIVINVNRRPHFYRPDYDWSSHRGRWHHEPSHRRGAVYRDRPTAERFGQPPARVERAERQSTRSRLRGPVTGSGVGVSSGTREAAGESGSQAAPARIKEPRPPVAGDETLTGKAERRRGGVAVTPRVESAPKVARTPGVDASRPVQKQRDQDEEAGRVSSESRQLRNEPEGGAGPGRDRVYDRRGGSSRESRPESNRERDAAEERGGFSRGGRR